MFHFHGASTTLAILNRVLQALVEFNFDSLPPERDLNEPGAHRVLQMLHEVVQNMKLYRPYLPHHLVTRHVAEESDPNTSTTDRHVERYKVLCQSSATMLHHEFDAAHAHGQRQSSNTPRESSRSMIGGGTIGLVKVRRASSRTSQNRDGPVGSDGTSPLTWQDRGQQSWEKPRAPIMQRIEHKSGTVMFISLSNIRETIAVEGMSKLQEVSAALAHTCSLLLNTPPQIPPTHTNGEQPGTTSVGASRAWKVFLAPVDQGSANFPPISLSFPLFE